MTRRMTDIRIATCLFKKTVMEVRTDDGELTLLDKKTGDPIPMYEYQITGAEKIIGKMVHDHNAEFELHANRLTQCTATFYVGDEAFDGFGKSISRSVVEAVLAFLDKEKTQQ